jgi:ABC-type Zn uptake system ZnuABC Zn-binding protein ZnuA
MRLDINRARCRLLVGLLTVALAVVACSTSAGPSGLDGLDGSLQVVATTTVFADIVANVGGDRVTVRSIIPAGVGPEDYEPKPDDARAIDGADLIVSNGVGLDDFLDGLVEANGNDAPRLVLGDGIPTITVDGVENPHFWLDPTLVTGYYLPAIEATLSDIDPSGAVTYQANAAAYAAAIETMDTELKSEADALPAANRKVVTFHDAFPYFARHFGFELIGVILGSPGQEPSAGELAKLVDAVRAAGVKAVFSEAQFSPALAETLAREAGITKTVTTLYNDALGPEPADTYLGMMRWNMAKIVEALR